MSRRTTKQRRAARRRRFGYHAARCQALVWAVEDEGDIWAFVAFMLNPARHTYDAQREGRP